MLTKHLFLIVCFVFIWIPELLKHAKRKQNFATGEFTTRLRMMTSQLFVTLYTLSIHPSAHKLLRRHLPNPFREFPCIKYSESFTYKKIVSVLTLLPSFASVKIGVSTPSLLLRRKLRREKWRIQKFEKAKDVKM